MQLIIELPEEIYKVSQIIDVKHEDVVQIPLEVIANGTLIPDNATNGDIMQIIFPNGVTAEFATFMRFVVGEDGYIDCAYDWWNASYQKGDKG